MIKVFIKSKTAIISRTLIVSGSLLFLSACDNNEHQEKGKDLNAELGVPSEPKAKQENEFAKVKQPVANIERRQYKQSKAVGSLLPPPESLLVEQDKPVEQVILDLSLNLGITEYELERDKQKPFQGIFEPEETIFDIEMETRFEWPHNENKERDLTPDGAGISIKVGI